MIQHDMLLFDHGMPGKDGRVREHQRPEADVNIEFQSKSKFASGAAELAWTLLTANEQYATDYPAVVGPHMTNTDSMPFMDLVPAISIRELERVSHSAAVGTRPITSPSTSIPTSLTAISASASTRPKPLWERSRSSPVRS